MNTGKFFQRPQIALALRARANCLALKKFTCALENHAIAYTKKRYTVRTWSGIQHLHTKS